VNLRVEVIEGAHVVAGCEKLVGEMGADETRSTRDEDGLLSGHAALLFCFDAHVESIQ
jgi:hypothetical protein